MTTVGFIGSGQIGSSLARLVHRTPGARQLGGPRRVHGNELAGTAAELGPTGVRGDRARASAVGR